MKLIAVSLKTHGRIEMRIGNSQRRRHTRIFRHLYHKDNELLRVRTYDYIRLPLQVSSSFLDYLQRTT